MADPLAEVSDLEQWLGESISEDERAKAVLYLTRASNLIRSFAGASRVEAGGEVEDSAFTITLAVTSRVWVNPDGATQASDTTGSDTASRSWGPKGADGFYLTKSEKEELRRPGNTLYVQPTTRVIDDEDDDSFVDVEGGSPLPFIERWPF